MCRRGSRRAVLLGHRPAAAKLIELGRQRMVLVEQRDLAAANSSSGLSPTLTHSTPSHPNYDADQRRAHAVEQRVVLDLVAAMAPLAAASARCSRSRARPAPRRRRPR